MLKYDDLKALVRENCHKPFGFRSAYTEAVKANVGVDGETISLALSKAYHEIKQEARDHETHYYPQ